MRLLSLRGLNAASAAKRGSFLSQSCHLWMLEESLVRLQHLVVADEVVLRLVPLVQSWVSQSKLA